MSITKINLLMLYRGIFALHCKNRAGHVNMMCGQNVVCFLRVQACDTRASHRRLKG